MPPKCSICGREDEFSRESEKCIFHCAKTAENGWYQQNGEKKKWNKKLVKEFWTQIRTKKMAKKDYNFSRFIFPEFEDIFYIVKKSVSKTIQLSDGRKKTIIIYRTNEAVNFWDSGNELGFSGGANFSEANFSGEADFSRTEFSEKANFIGAKFSEKVEFIDSNFFGEVSFLKANFFGETYFFSANFFERTYFLYTKFSGEVYFGNANFSGEAYFRYASFSNTHATLFEKTKFQGFQENQQKILPALLRNIDFPESVKFRQTDLSRVSFLDSNLEKAHFENCSWGYLKPSAQQVNQGEILKFQKSASRNILWNEWVKEEDDDECVKEKDDDECVKEKDFAKIEILNRQLKKNFEEKKDYETAGDFHLGEMAMRRQKFRQERKEIVKDRVSSFERQLTKIWNSKIFKFIIFCLSRLIGFCLSIWSWLFFNTPKRFLLFWYWLFSDYGERPGRVFCWFALIFVFAGVYFWSPDFDNFGSSLEFAFKSFVPLLIKNAEIENFSACVRIIFYFEVLLSTILWFLLLLAIRRKFRR